MKNMNDILERMRRLEAKLNLIETEIGKELLEPFHRRDVSRCRFLDLEKRIHSASLNELKWMINE